MQTFPPLCIYNFGLPRRTPSPRPPTRAITLRPSALPTARVHERRRTRPRHGNGGGPSLAGTFPWRRTEVDGAELTRTTNAAWAGRRLARTTYVKMARRGKNARVQSVKKNSEMGSTLWICKSKCKVPWSWTIFRLCK